MKKKMYFVLWGKRALKIYPAILVITLATLVALTLAAVMILRGSNDGEDKQKVTMGVVGNTSDTFFDIGIDVIKNIDHSRLYIDLVTMTRDNAKKALEADEITGYLDVPDGYIDGIASLKNIPAAYYIANKPDSLGTALTREVVNTVAVYITETQRVASGTRSYIRANGLEKGDSINKVSKQILTNVLLPRNELYETEYTGIADSLSAGGYYIMGLLLFFMLLWGISCSRMLTGNSLSVSRFLYTRGMGSTWQMLCEYGVYLITTFATLVIIALLFGIGIYNFRTGIPELETVGILECIGFIFLLIPVILAICAMQIFIFEAVKGTVPAVLLQFLTAVVLGYLSGCFYPNYFFPQALRSIIELLPPGCAFLYMRKALISEFAPGQLLLLLAYAAVFFMGAAAIRKKRMAGDGE